MVQSFYYMLACRRDEALETVQKARELFQQLGHLYALSGTWWMEGWVRYQLAEYDASRRCYDQIKTMLEATSYWDYWHQAMHALICGLNDLKEGQTQSARRRLADFKAMLPAIAESDPDHLLMANDHSLLFEGEILLSEGRVEDAIEICLSRLEVGIPTISSSDIFFYNLPAERDVLARAYIANGSLDKAIAEYERLVTFDAASENRRLVYALLFYRLGLLYEQRGFKDKATEQYQHFLAIAEGASAALDEAVDARQRLAAITGAER
jgi:tetratricopeptide (TPR) repeat protein